MRSHKEARIAGAFGAFALATALAAAPVQAFNCYSTNPGASGTASTTTYDVTAYGGSGYFVLHSATPSSGHSIAHPFETSSTGTSFTGLGTFKGAGNSGGCSATAGTAWGTYADYRTNGVYHCASFSKSYANTDSTSHSFDLSFRFGGCGNISSNAWCWYFDATLTFNRTLDFSSGYVSAGGESVGASGQSIAVDYKSLYTRGSTGVYTGWQYRTTCSNSPYVVTGTADNFGVH